jgi:small-conductance mechanosensitive channel
MNIHIHIHHHGHSKDEDVLHNVFTLTKSIHTKTVNIMADLQALTQEVSETRTVMESAKTLILGLKQKLDEAGTDPVKLEELRQSLDQGGNDLAAAIEANTPAEGETPEGPTPPIEG